MPPLYPERYLLRTAERLLTRVELLLNRLMPSHLNPFYHLGTISIFLLLILAATGLYLTILYRPNADVAYASVAGISAHWFGSLIRSTHRYAADALVVTLLLHALKMLLSERFWGSRWLSWVSGWSLLAIIWLIGAMGYWLVWDQRAQWLNEYAVGLIGGAVQLAFATRSALSQTFTFFIIILFLHIFLSVAILGGLFIHLLRLSRARIWLPAWIMGEVSIALVLVALWRPATSALPADTSRLVGDMAIDWWYLGFLPLIEQWGSPMIWALSSLVAGGLVALPWLARGRHLGPATVANPQCTGCAICAQECPYGAIEMQPQTQDSRYESVAVINPKLCTGCGVCVGTCATTGVDLPGLPAAQLRRQLASGIEAARGAAGAPIVVFACQRHVALGTLPPTPEPVLLQPTRPGKLPEASATPDDFQLWYVTPEPEQQQLGSVYCPVPCVGMIQPEWIRDAMSQGSSTIVVVGCHTLDCGFREGPRWVTSRLVRRQKLVQQGVHILEATPGDQHIRRQLANGKVPVREPRSGTEQSTYPWRMQRSIAGWVACLAVILVIVITAVAADQPSGITRTGAAMIRLVLTHPGQLSAANATLSGPVDATTVQALSGERLPVRIRIEISGLPIIERTYIPGGLRHDGTIYGYEEWTLQPGRHPIRLWMMDDGATWQLQYEGTIELAPGQARSLVYHADDSTVAVE